MSRITFLIIIAAAFGLGLFIGGVALGGGSKDALQTQVDEQTAQIASLKDQRDDALGAVEPKDQEIADLTAQLENAMASASAPVEVPAADGDSEAVAALEAQVTAMAAELATANGELSVAQAQRDEAKQALDAMLAQADEGADNAMGDALAAAEQALATAQSEAGDMLNAAKDSAAQALSDAKAKADEALAALTAEKDGEIKGLMSSLTGAEEQSASLQGMLDEAKGKIADLESTIEDLRNAPPVQLVIDGVANTVGQ